MTLRRTLIASTETTPTYDIFSAYSTISATTAVLCRLRQLLVNKLYCASTQNPHTHSPFSPFLFSCPLVSASCLYKCMVLLGSDSPGAAFTPLPLQYQSPEFADY